MKKIVGSIIGVILALLIMIIGAGISFGIVGLIVKGICWAFGLAFTWKFALGVWLILLLAGGLFNVTVQK